MPKKTTTNTDAATDTVTDTTTDAAGTTDVSQLGSEVTAVLITADSTAAQRVQELQWAHQARASLLNRTAAALKKQLGDNDPRVKAAEAALAAANLTAARVGVAQQQVATPDVQVSATGWALQGRAFDAQLKPVSGFTVFLVDGTNTYQQPYGFSYTDDTGYFLLNYAGPDAATKGTSATGKTAGAPSLFVAVVDANAQPVYLGTTPFQPVSGAASYQNITVSNAPIGDPPAQIRNVAMPKAKKGS
jgi:hypothetical protein